MSTRLRLSLCAAVAALHTAALAQNGPQQQLSVDALNSPQGLSGASVRGAAFSPDGKTITVLQGQEGDARKLDLWAYDAETGEGRVLVRSDDLQPEEVELSEEEKNRRERQRIYTTGIISYQWDKAGEKLLFPLGGDVFTYDLASGTPTRVTDTPETFETDPKLSPLGNYVSYVRDDELVVYDVARERERQVTKGADGTIRNAVAEFVVQEELNRDTGYWWSPDEQFIAHTQIDESPVMIAERLDFGPDGTETIRQRYPFAGTDNVKIKMGITSPRGGRTRWIDLGENEDIYVASAHWSADGKTLYVVRLSRDQKTLDMLAVDPRSGRSRVAFTEKSDTWINLEFGYRALPGGGFLWESERTGFNHIYRYDAEGKLMYPLTEGEWPVGDISCVDEAEGEVYFSGWQNSALENHVFSVPLAGGEVEQITTIAGWHSATFGKGCETFIHRFSSPDQPPQTSVRDSAGAQKFWLLENALDVNHHYAPYVESHEPWTYGQLRAEDGQLVDYQLLVPGDLEPGAKAPAIQLVYGGPHVQRVRKSWGNLYAQYLADLGYVVLMADNRGASNRGKAFEDVLYRQMGQPEVRDQAMATQWLANQDFVDGDNIGVQGWSYGGYMVLMMLGQHPELYKAGISGAPVTDWRTYDTAYTERYMGDPREVAEAYDASSVLTYSDNIKDDALLLIHGMADDNVIFQNAIDVMAALQKNGTQFELMTYPGEKHGFRDPANRRHRDLIGLDFFARRLKGEE